MLAAYVTKNERSYAFNNVLIDNIDEVKTKIIKGYIYSDTECKEEVEKLFSGIDAIYYTREDLKRGFFQLLRGQNQKEKPNNCILEINFDTFEVITSYPTIDNCAFEATFAPSTEDLILYARDLLQTRKYLSFHPQIGSHLENGV